MKTVAALAITLLLPPVGIQWVTPAAAGEQVATTTPPSVKEAAPSVKENVIVDCSKEVWPDFSPSCLRNANATEVRLVTVNRRQ
jgi:hypothetical protein